ncbi:MAG TPA: hypothetical protein VE955_07145 [Candidatus Dormibacteraeota bacterium]|jgi:hypothetical protein|nr:hypothetical protein [Candidatus Dormibacteraeota bacterium]
MSERADSGNEIRRILLLTRLRDSPKGLTMDQLVKDCSKISGWSSTPKASWESVRHVLQSLINDHLVVVKNRFSITVKGREYLADPSKWRLNVENREEEDQKLFWDNIYAIFDKALARIKSRSQSPR